MANEIKTYDAIRNYAEDGIAAYASQIYDENLQMFQQDINRVTDNGFVYDISAAHNNTKYADLTAALGTDGANIPEDLRKGGMSIKFIQGTVQSSDNKYVQYRLMSDTFNTTPANWQGVDDEPTADSDNLVKSGGIFPTHKSVQNGLLPINGKVGIIGDSISTFNGTMPSGYRTYYPYSDVLSVYDTWWNLILSLTGSVLDVNASWSGSRVTNGREGEGYPDFYDRTNLFHDPDYIFVALGTNDATNNVSMGNYDYDSAISDLSEAEFIPAYIKGVKALQSNYPNAKIVLLLLPLPDRNNRYSEVITNIGEHFELPVIDVASYYTGNVHPDKNGMCSIAQDICSFYITKRDKFPILGSHKSVESGGVAESIITISGMNFASKMIENRAIMCTQTVGETNNESEAVLSGWQCIRLIVKEGQVFSLTMRGGSSYPGYFILDNENIVLAKDTITSPHSITITIPANADTLVVNNQKSAATAMVLLRGSINDIDANLTKINSSIYEKDLSNIFTGNTNRAVLCTADVGEVSNIIDSILNGWTYARIAVEEYTLYQFEVRGGSSYPAYFIVDANNKVLEKATVYTINKFTVFIPKGGVTLVINNDLSKVSTPNLERIATNATIKYVNDKIDLTELEEIEATNYLQYSYNPCYIESNGNPHESISWKSWLIPANSDVSIKCYTNSLSFKNAAFYTGLPSTTTFISGISVIATDVLSSINIKKADIPSGAKYILISSRVASGDGSSVLFTREKSIDIKDDIEILKFGKPNIDAIYRGLPNTNDFIIIKDEIWFGENIYEGGVATETTIIHRYKFVGEDIVYKGKLTTDFGHWNTVDYNPNNDCLLFTNSANEPTTEGNYFTVIKNPLNLSGTVSKANVGIKYDVDLGLKVNAVWGNGNLGQNNVIYILSNNAANFTKVLLQINSSGDFNGNYVVLEQRTTGRDIAINGMAFWNNTIYIGMTNRSIILLDLYDFSFTVLQEKYYRENGDEITGSTQGIVINSVHLWQFINVSGAIENYLIKTNR